MPKGQWEAGHTVGFSHTQTLTRIVLPQAARVSVPPLSNTFISLVKDTSLASLILVTELFRRAQEIATATLPTAYSRMRSQPMIQAMISPIVAYE